MPKDYTFTIFITSTVEAMRLAEIIIKKKLAIWVILAVWLL